MSETRDIYVASTGMVQSKALAGNYMASAGTVCQKLVEFPWQVLGR